MPAIGDAPLMDRAAYQQLLRDVAGADSTNSISAAEERLNRENEVVASIHQNYGGLMTLGYAIHQFYRDTLGEIATRLPTHHPTDKQSMYVHWHIAGFARYAAALDLLVRGYYAESATLARGLWEMALTLCAIQRDVVTLKDISGGEGDPDVTVQQAFARRMAADRKIQAVLLWKNTDLSPEAMRALNTFVRLLNAATHKSILHLAMNLHVMERGQGIPIFPEFEDRNVTGTANLLFLSTWSLMTTIRYFGSLAPQEDESWSTRYTKALATFSEGIATGPSPLVQAFGRVIDQVFVSTTG